MTIDMKTNGPLGAAAPKDASLIAGLSGDSRKWLDQKTMEKEKQDHLLEKQLSAKEKQKITARYLVIAMSVFTIIISVTLVTKSLPDETVIRKGYYNTNKKTDLCLQNLWVISGRIQKGEKDPAHGLKCPATGAGYLLRHGDDGMAVYCPNPEIHKVSALFVTKGRPVPEVVK
jgi:hypothetical protein